MSMGIPTNPTSFATSGSSPTAHPASSPATCCPSRPSSATVTMSFFYNPRRLTAARVVLLVNQGEGNNSDEQSEDYQRAGPRPGQGHRVLYAKAWFRGARRQAI